MQFQCSACKGIVAVEDTELGIDVQCGHCGNVVKTPESRVAPGAMIADFIIRKELGRGGMGVVYLAHQISLDRSAALKILAEHYANDSQFVVSFINEARAAAKLNHPHIVQAYAVGEDNGIFYFAMEAIDGRTMKSVLEEYKLIPEEQALQIIQQIAEALSYAWNEQKLIHRDIKPDNIMLTNSGRAKLSDLGLASHGGDMEDSEADEVMGTPQYISPEHLTGAPMDARSDIYSLGATFYHFVTGCFPYQGRNAVEIAQQHLIGTLIPPDQINSNVSPEVSAIIMKMMARNPQDRYQTAGELVDDIRRVCHTVDGVTSAIHLPPPGQQPVKKAAVKLKNSSTQSQLRIRPAGKKTLKAMKKTARKKKKKNIGLIAGCSVFGLLLLGLGIAFPFLYDKYSAPETAEKQTTAPQKTDFEIELEKVCAHAKYNSDRPSEITANCEKIMTSPDFRMPETPGEKERYAEMLGYYSKIDEALLEQHRQNAARKYEEQLTAIRQQQEAEAERIAEEKRQAEEAVRQQQIAAAEAKRKQEALQRQREALKKNVILWKKEAAAALLKLTFEDGGKSPSKNLELVKEALAKCLDNEALKSADAEIQRSAQELKVWAEGVQNSFQRAAQIGLYLDTVDDSLDGIKVELSGKKYELQIRKTKNGKRLLLRHPSGMSSPFSKLDPEEADHVLEAVAEKHGLKDLLWMYYLLRRDNDKAVKAGSEGLAQLKKLAE